MDAPVLEDRYMAFGRRLGLIVHAFVLSFGGCPACFLSQIPIRAYRLPAWLRGSEPGGLSDGRLEISFKKRFSVPFG
jgi:hypothetical protein